MSCPGVGLGFSAYVPKTHNDSTSLITVCSSWQMHATLKTALFFSQDLEGATRLILNKSLLTMLYIRCINSQTKTANSNK